MKPASKLEIGPLEGNYVVVVTAFASEIHFVRLRLSGQWSLNLAPFLLLEREVTHHRILGLLD